MQRLLARGFLLSQAVQRWSSRAIWVMSRADAAYPQRLKKRLGMAAPAVLYGCGDVGLLDAGGLAVVGSRDVDDTLLAYTEAVGKLAAHAKRPIVSGGARGVDQASVHGAIANGGRAIAMLADSLEKAALKADHRDAVREQRLVLVSPYDLSARFNVGNAMQRNKLIYALADAAVVVNSDVNKGGTWAGAKEQLEKLKLVTVHVRQAGARSSGLDALRSSGRRTLARAPGSQGIRGGLGAMPAQALAGGSLARLLLRGDRGARQSIARHLLAPRREPRRLRESSRSAHLGGRDRRRPEHELGADRGYSE